MKNAYILLVFLSCLGLSCSRSNDFIIPVDYREYYEGASTSMTEEESRSLSQKITADMQINTLGKRIPNIKVKDWNGKNFRLQKLIKDGAVLIFSAYDCSYGAEEVEHEFPRVLRDLETEAEDVRIICLVENSANKKKEVDQYVWKLMTEYCNVFLIEPADAARINLTAIPTKFYINKEGQVVHMSVGYVAEQAYREQDIRIGIDKIKQRRL